MAGLRYLTGRSGGSSGGGGSTKFPVLGGRGLLAGNSEGAVARELIQAGAIRIIDGDAIAGNPLIYTLNGLTEIATGTINGAGGPQQLNLVPEMSEVEITHVSFRRFSATPSSVMRGGIYAAPPINGVNQQNAAIVPDTTQYSAWPGGLATIRKDVTVGLRKPVFLWWCPTTPSPTALTFEVSVWGMPNWQKSWA